MRVNTVGTVLYAVALPFNILRIAGAVLLMEKGAVAKEAVKVVAQITFVAGIIFAFFIGKKATAVFHDDTSSNHKLTSFYPL